MKSIIIILLSIGSSGAFAATVPAPKPKYSGLSSEMIQNQINLANAAIVVANYQAAAQASESALRVSDLKAQVEKFKAQLEAAKSAGK